MHWSLFIFFNHENGKNGIFDLFFQDRFVYSKLILIFFSCIMLLQ
jgi:hypothetical protein